MTRFFVRTIGYERCNRRDRLFNSFGAVAVHRKIGRTPHAPDHSRVWMLRWAHPVSLFQWLPIPRRHLKGSPTRQITHRQHPRVLTGRIR
ncbi:hypothetical protein EVAR_13871_1 [Eumeta japonica]|uniref:Uncharacterized protein n=1 Tax=Eumeta variegata TaxID=151549 RepID=A0A4C1U1D6_EUMVA|nr:hypothetical protein EVAR_13871_1 [Eumeta japonica]